MIPSRRKFLEIAAWAAGNATAVASAAQASATIQLGDGGFGRDVRQLPPGDAVVHHDPGDIGAMPDFRASLDGLTPHVATGGWVKEVSVKQFPIARGIAGVHVFLNPGASRELHWHATAAEWAFVIDGHCQTVVIEPSGASEINNFEPGDLWYFKKGHGHAIQTIGDKPCHVILAFNDGAFTTELGAFSITDWVHLTPGDWLAKEFGLSKDAFDLFPKGEVYVQAGPILDPADAMDAPWPRESTHRFRLMHDNTAARDFDGGVFRVASSVEFPASTDMSGGILRLAPGALYKSHWHPNANEFHYYLKGKGQVALFGSGGRGRVAQFGPGDVAYIPQGFGHAIRNVGDEDLEIVQTWDNGLFQEIFLDRWVQSSPRHLLANNFTGVPTATLAKLKKV